MAEDRRPHAGRTSQTRHQWLYLHGLDSIERLRGLVEFYVEQHNGVMPQAAFDGQTPDEMFFGIGAGVGQACWGCCVRSVSKVPMYALATGGMVVANEVRTPCLSL